MQRFTISVTEEMACQLDLAQKEFYFGIGKTEMLRDLISRGLADAMAPEREEPALCREEKKR